MSKNLQNSLWNAFLAAWLALTVWVFTLAGFGTGAVLLAVAACFVVGILIGISQTAITLFICVIGFPIAVTILAFALSQ